MLLGDPLHYLATVLVESVLKREELGEGELLNELVGCVLVLDSVQVEDGVRGSL